MNKFLLLSLLAAPAVFAQTQYVVHNKCPTSINLYIAGELNGTIATGKSVTKTLSANPGFFYTDANGGNKDGSATRAGFFTDSAYYYIVKDSDHFNTGISITPKGQAARLGFCEVAECDSVSCDNSYTSPPTRFPNPGKTAPAPPLYECPGKSVSYDITFCPSGSFPEKPAPEGTQIHPTANTKKCLDVRAANFANGTPVQVYDCNGTPAQNWVIKEGSTSVQLAGTNYCLDAGSNPASGVGMKIWQCYDNLPAQEWQYTVSDGHIILENKGQCLDLTNGVLTNGNQVQTWSCSSGNKNQVWVVGNATPPPPPPPKPTVHQIHPNGNTKKCLDVRAANFASGTPVQIYDCNGTPAQNWNLVKGSTKVQVNGTNFCLDAGSSPANGIGLKIWQCYDNLPAQQWYYTGDNRVALENQGFCVDLTNGVLTNGNQAQEWRCTDGNKNQIWTV